MGVVLREPTGRAERTYTEPTQPARTVRCDPAECRDRPGQPTCQQPETQRAKGASLGMSGRSKYGCDDEEIGAACPRAPQVA